ncbi:MAG TPA: DUF4188 domain-containing protein [Micromonosporaceae bacterium]|jgi:hypothetical protein
MATTNGRMTAQIEGDFVVFLIGMRLNKPWKLHKWLPVVWAMAPMIRELSRNRDLGLLGMTNWLGPRGTLMVQYWRSVEQLEAFARDTDRTHRPAWKAFYQKVGTNGDVGIWHESYVVRDGAYETLYGNMPRFGLAQAGSHRSLTGAMHSAAGRRTTNAAA